MVPIQMLALKRPTYLTSLRMKNQYIAKMTPNPPMPTCHGICAISACNSLLRSCMFFPLFSASCIFAMSRSLLCLNCLNIWHGTVSTKCHNRLPTSHRARHSESSSQHNSEHARPTHPFPHNHRTALFPSCSNFNPNNERGSKFAQRLAASFSLIALRNGSVYSSRHVGANSYRRCIASKASGNGPSW